MEKMLIRLLPILFGAVVLVLGFASCSFNDDSIDEFGARCANYKVSGSVTDEDGKGIKEMQVVTELSYNDSLNAGSERDTLYTDKDGRYEKMIVTYPFNNAVLTFNDVDGERNGGDFESVSQPVNLIRTEPGSGWFEGSFSVSADVKLKKK